VPALTRGHQRQVRWMHALRREPRHLAVGQTHVAVVQVDGLDAGQRAEAQVRFDEPDVG